MTDEHKKKEIDHLSGVETTGHEWDGLKELNNPAPRWWLIVWIITIVWSVWYWVVYPAWPVPGGATEGMKNWTQYKKLAAEQAEIAARQNVYLGRFEQASFEEILADPELYAFAVAGGHAAFKDNCATCHGSGAEGGKGYPNLNDDDWLWGGTIEDINQTLHYGIRSGHDEARISEMPAFGKDELLAKEDIDNVVAFVMSLSGETGEGHGESDTAQKGAEVFAENCAACHGEQGEGGRDFGAPRLDDAIWLYGGTHDDIFQTVYNAHAGVMPAWSGRLDENTIRQLAVYVHQLGGGEDNSAESATESDVQLDVADPETEAGGEAPEDEPAPGMPAMDDAAEDAAPVDLPEEDVAAPETGTGADEAGEEAGEEAGAPSENADHALTQETEHDGEPGTAEGQPAEPEHQSE